MGFIAGIAQVYPPKTNNGLQLYIVSFVILSFLAIVLIFWQSFRTQEAARISREFQENLVKQIVELKNSSEGSLHDIKAQLEKISSYPETSLKKRGLELSRDILQFLIDMGKKEPPLPKSETWQEDVEKSIRFSRDLMNTYSLKFASRVIAMRDSFADKGYTDKELDMFYEHPTNPIGIRIVGERIGALAEKAEEVLRLREQIRSGTRLEKGREGA